MPILKLLTKFRVFCDVCNKFYKDKEYFYAIHRRAVKSTMAYDGWKVTTHKTICPDCRGVEW